MTPITDKLESLISGYGINQDDADWLRGVYTSQQAEPMLNGLTEAETAQTASVAGLVNREPSEARVEAAAKALLARRELKLEHLTDKAREHYLEDARAVLQAADAVSAGVAVPGWLPIETAPKDGRKMLLFYLNANGQARRVIGGWVTEEEAAETDADGVGLEAGWYERIDNWPDYYQVAIHEGEPTHWMHLPAAPGSEQKEGTS